MTTENPSFPDSTRRAPASGPLGPRAPETGGATARLGRLLIGLAILIGVVGLVGMQITVPYVIQSPGDATPITDYVTIDGARTYRHRGGFLLLTVRVSSGRPNVWRFLEAHFDEDQKVISEKDYYGPTPPKRAQRESVQRMDESEIWATTAALTRLGYEVVFTGRGALVDGVQEGSPAADAGLRRGDVIVGIDGDEIRRGDQVGTTIRARPVGTEFAVTIERNGRRRELAVTSARAPAGQIKGLPYFGIQAGTFDLEVRSPVDVKIDAGDVSGPSGGLAFTLTIIDEMTPRSLSGGRPIAVTGSIDADGNVGAVGGVPQKAVAARRAGAALMIVPRSEVREARTKAGDMPVVGVETLDEALAALQRRGGAPVPVPATT